VGWVGGVLAAPAWVLAQLTRSCIFLGCFWERGQRLGELRESGGSRNSSGGCVLCTSYLGHGCHHREQLLPAYSTAPSPHQTGPPSPLPQPLTQSQPPASPPTPGQRQTQTAHGPGEFPRHKWSHRPVIARGVQRGSLPPSQLVGIITRTVHIWFHPQNLPLQGYDHRWTLSGIGGIGPAGTHTVIYTHTCTHTCTHSCTCVHMTGCTLMCNSHSAYSTLARTFTHTYTYICSHRYTCSPIHTHR
jgi:hypothetical protein